MCKVQSCTLAMKAVQSVPGSCHSLASGAAYLLCQYLLHEAINQVSAMHWLEGVQHALEKTVTPWAAWAAVLPSSLPGGCFWGGKTRDWKPVAHGCVPPASHPGEWCPVLELTLQTWHREMPASPSMNPSWTSTDLLCSCTALSSSQ